MANQSSRPVEQNKIRCANCGLEIVESPVVRQGEVFCCGGCAEGGPCYCSYDPVDNIQPPAPAAPQPEMPGHAATSRRM